MTALVLPPLIPAYPARPARQFLFPYFLAFAVELDDLSAVGTGDHDPTIAAQSGPGRPLRLAAPNFLTLLVDLPHLVQTAAAHQEVSIGQQLDTAPVARVAGRNAAHFLAFGVQLDHQAAADDVQDMPVAQLLGAVDLDVRLL